MNAFYNPTRRHAMRALTSNIEPLRPVGRVEKDFNSLVKMFDDVRLSAYKNLLTYKNFYYPTEALKENAIVFKKRLSFARNMNPKLQNKIASGLRIISRVASGHYRAEDLMTGQIVIVPVEQLIRTNLNEAQVKEILGKMNC